MFTGERVPDAMDQTQLIFINVDFARRKLSPNGCMHIHSLVAFAKKKSQAGGGGTRKEKERKREKKGKKGIPVV